MQVLVLAPRNAELVVGRAAEHHGDRRILDKRANSAISVGHTKVKSFG
jgi:hypothetical protein